MNELLAKLTGGQLKELHELASRLDGKTICICIAADGKCAECPFRPTCRALSDFWVECAKELGRRGL